jgi:hypothetical protein
MGRIDTSTSESWAAGLVAQLEGYRQKLPACYGGDDPGGSYLADLSADFPWHGQADEVARLVQEHASFAGIAADFTRNHGVDLAAFLADMRRFASAPADADIF